VTDAPAEAKRLAESNLPNSGAVHAVFASDRVRGETRAGYDATTGAWYWVTGIQALGLDAQGSLFGGNTDVPMRREDPGSMSEDVVESPFPFVIWLYILDNSDQTERVESLEGGGSRITLLLSEGRRFVPPPLKPGPAKREMIDVDALGRIVRVAKEGEPKEYEKAYEYPTDQRDPFWVPSKLRGTQVLVSIEVTEGGEASAFSMEAAERRWKEINYRDAQAQSKGITTAELIRSSGVTVSGEAKPSVGSAEDADNQKSLKNAQTPENPTTAPRSSGSGWFDLRLLAGGAAVLLIAAAVWWKRRG
jgi:hypothetical protein